MALPDPGRSAHRRSKSRRRIRLFYQLRATVTNGSESSSSWAEVRQVRDALKVMELSILVYECFMYSSGDIISVEITGALALICPWAESLYPGLPPCSTPLNVYYIVRPTTVTGACLSICDDHSSPSKECGGRDRFCFYCVPGGSSSPCRRYGWTSVTASSGFQLCDFFSFKLKINQLEVLIFSEEKKFQSSNGTSCACTTW